jgi:hypothetical protein
VATNPSLFGVICWCHLRLISPIFPVDKLMAEWLVKPSPMSKSTVDQIRERFDGDVERFSNLETGQSATIDAPLSLALIAEAALRVTPRATSLLDGAVAFGRIRPSRTVTQEQVFRRVWRDQVSPINRLCFSYWIQFGFGLDLTPFNEGENAGQMEQPHALYFSGFADRDGANETLTRPLVKFGPGATGIKLVPALGCPHPDRQTAIPVGHDLRHRRSQ